MSDVILGEYRKADSHFSSRELSNLESQLCAVFVYLKNLSPDGVQAVQLAKVKSNLKYLLAWEKNIARRTVHGPRLSILIASRENTLRFLHKSTGP